jgi:hypothetical protein
VKRDREEGENWVISTQETLEEERSELVYIRHRLTDLEGVNKI